MSVSGKIEETDQPQIVLGTKNEGEEESSKGIISVEQSEQEFGETMEIDNCPTAVGSIYSFLFSEVKEYLPKSQFLKFKEADLIFRQVAENIKLDTPALAQIIQKHIEEFLETTISQSTANQIVAHLSAEKKEEVKELL